MATRHDATRLPARLGSVLLSVGLCATAARGQESPDVQAEREALEQRVRTYLLQRTAERKAEAARPAAQQQRARGQTTDPRGEAARRRLEALESARDVYREAGWETAEQSLRRAIRAAELELEAAAARQRAPGPEDMAELLRKAAELHEERGHGDRAQVLRRLSQDYQARTDRAPEAPQPRAVDVGDIEDLARRIEIVRLAMHAHAQAGRQDAADVLRRFLHVAELQRDGASGEAMAQALEGIELRTVLRLLQEASGLCRKQGQPERAAACAALAEFYAARWNLDEAPDSGRPEREVEAPATQQQVAIRRLMQRVERLEAELQEVKAALRRATQDRR